MMEDEPVNCWFTNSLNPFSLESYSEEDKNSKQVDFLLILWSGLLERLGALCNDKKISNKVEKASESLVGSVAFYQGSNNIHKLNPVAGFALFRDSLNHILKATISWNRLEDDDLPPLTSEIILMLVNSASNHCKKYPSPWPEEILTATQELSECMINFDTNITWPFMNIFEEESGLYSVKKVSLQDLSKVPEIYSFGQLIRFPLALGLLANCKSFWFEDLAENSGLHGITAKAQLITEYIEEIQPTILQSIDEESWPEWAIGLLPIVPDI